MASWLRVLAALSKGPSLVPQPSYQAFYLLVSSLFLSAFFSFVLFFILCLEPEHLHVNHMYAWYTQRASDPLEL